MGFRGDAVRAFAAGRQAAKDKRPVTVCPHPAGALRRMWIRGYARAAPPLPTELPPVDGD